MPQSIPTTSCFTVKLLRVESKMNGAKYRAILEEKNPVPFCKRLETVAEVHLAA